MKKLFIVATRQNDGKTMISLGLFNAFQKRYCDVAYMKPVGQQYKIVDGEKIDKDAVLMHNTYRLQDSLSDMSPIAIPRKFTRNYINNENQVDLRKKIKDSFNVISRDKKFVLIEGTGHGGVGSVFDVSNADVAKLVNSKVIMVALGGVGKPIDEILLNKALFDKNGVELLGVIINKVQASKYDDIKEIVTKGLKRHGIKVFGVIPLVDMLNKPSVAELVEDLDAKLLSASDKSLMNTVEKFVIGDMLPHAALEALNRNSILIVPGNRDGLILTALCGNLLVDKDICNVAAFIFTDGIQPHGKILEFIKSSNTPAMVVKEDSFSVATKINNSIFKLRIEEYSKIQQSQELVNKYVDVDRICKLI